jgi:hypothetical protein
MACQAIQKTEFVEKKCILLLKYIYFNILASIETNDLVVY